jgi:hypothetical protein
VGSFELEKAVDFATNWYSEPFLSEYDNMVAILKGVKSRLFQCF